MGKGEGLESEAKEVESVYSIDDNGTFTELDEDQAAQGSSEIGETIVTEYEDGLRFRLQGRITILWEL